MKNRFEGPDGHRLLIDVLRSQKLVLGSDDLAETFAKRLELTDVALDEEIITQGGDANDLYFILAGSFAIKVNDKQVATRVPNDHVGEMAAILPSMKRSATVAALEPSVVGKLTEADFASIANNYPVLWRRIASELARRLEQRNHLITAARPRIRVFVISSVEALDIARAVQNAFAHDDFSVTVWTDGVFKASSYPVESLEREVDSSDFAIAIAQGDDVVRSRKRQRKVPRDNVIFELGFFMGRLGRHRTILIEPREDRVALPSDLSGITTTQYKLAPGESLAVSLAPACNQIRETIREFGPNR